MAKMVEGRNERSGGFCTESPEFLPGFVLKKKTIAII